jgi:hypothetical protein
MLASRRLTLRTRMCHVRMRILGTGNRGCREEPRGRCRYRRRLLVLLSSLGRWDTVWVTSLSCGSLAFGPDYSYSYSYSSYYYSMNLFTFIGPLDWTFVHIIYYIRIAISFISFVRSVNEPTAHIISALSVCKKYRSYPHL